MSDHSEVRRVDRRMAERAAWELLRRSFVGRLGTVDSDGWPYVTPVLFAVVDGRVCFHHIREGGQLNANIAHDPRACFEADEPGEVVAGAAPGCGTALTYRSVMVFGRVRPVENEEERSAVCASLMRKYVGSWQGTPDAFVGRMSNLAVYALEVDWITGKEALPKEATA